MTLSPISLPDNLGSGRPLFQTNLAAPSGELFEQGGRRHFKSARKAEDHEQARLLSTGLQTGCSSRADQPFQQALPGSSRSRRSEPHAEYYETVDIATSGSCAVQP